jgi:hypothetical protein
MWLFNFFLVKRNLKQELQVKETFDKREFNQLAIFHHKAVLRYTLPPLPLHLLPAGQALPSSFPRFKNIDMFLNIDKLQNSDGYHKTLIFKPL